MKKLKKFAALLLAGVMVMALLTACGGGGTGEDAQAEASMMSAINGKRTTAQKLDNSAERKAVANQNIDLVVKNGFGSFNQDVKFTMDTDHIKDGKWGFTFVAKYDYKDTKLNDLINTITGGNGTNINSSHVDNWTDVGVVVKTVNGQTYIAVSVAVDWS